MRGRDVAAAAPFYYFYHEEGAVMKKLRTGAFAGLAILAAAAGVLWWAFAAPAGTVFHLYDRDRDQVVLSVPIKAGDRLSLEIEHSFEHIPWYEYYTVTDSGFFTVSRKSCGKQRDRRIFKSQAGYGKLP